MGIKYEVVANGGTYTNKNGEEKKRWVKCGVVMENDRGLSLKMESIPVGWDGWAILSAPEAVATIKMVSPVKMPQGDSDVPF